MIKYMNFDMFNDGRYVTNKLGQRVWQPYFYEYGRPTDISQSFYSDTARLQVQNLTLTPNGNIKFYSSQYSIGWVSDWTSDKGGRFAYAPGSTYSNAEAVILEPPSTPVGEITEFYFPKHPAVSGKSGMLFIDPFYIQILLSSNGSSADAHVYYKTDDAGGKEFLIKLPLGRYNAGSVHIGDKFLLINDQSVIQPTASGKLVIGYKESTSSFGNCYLYDPATKGIYETTILSYNTDVEFPITAFVLLANGDIDALPYYYQCFPKNNPLYKTSSRHSRTAIYLGDVP